MVSLIEQHREELSALCLEHRVKRLSVFGSAAGGEFEAESDLDFLVDFYDLRVEDGADRYLGLLVDLEDLFGRRVDLVIYGAIRNPYFKEVVDKTQVMLYAA